MATPSEPIAPGSRWLQETLGTRAVYEVVADRGAHIDVRVHEAPGLAAGTRIRLTRTAVAAMVPLPPDTAAQR